MARKTKQKKDDDDTPRQFKRLMAWQARISNPAQNNNAKKSKAEIRKQQIAKGGPIPTQNAAPPLPKLERKKGESMYEFGRRVDQAIPLPRAKGTDSRKTVKNAKKHKKTADNLRAEYEQRWEAKRRRQEEEDDANDNLTIEDDGEDIWASVNAKAKKPKFGEIADRPPELPRLKQFSSVPKSAGSLARRQMLEEERQNVIDSYRKLRGTSMGLPKEETDEENISG